MKIICYSKCSTCKGVLKEMDAKGLKYELRDIKEDNPTKEEIKKWHEATDYDIKRFFNTSGMIYRQENLKDKLKDMTLEEKYDKLASDGMLVRRPILFLDDGKILVGPDVKKYVESL
ncbi:Spx/MgsR family RNA polymerase-binding regulatory protein [uncultured Anaerococcus sp.]|uniref:Spx/MgsR family RNA polymerase-binding regulatory protein n=1 Tax=uncultured Anaerococcus sp. TaxID=293428 RepID=UPI0028891070|nr:Spx/MgsR family RNA polymerase-binding regulatory protein [uncultured Anaerococcus sp.]